MAGPRANLAVTKDGGSYNKLKRPADLLSTAPPATGAIERERTQDVSPAGRQTGNKRARTNNTSHDSEYKDEDDHTRGHVAECGMRETLPLGDEEYDEEELRPDDDALAYLLSVRSEASAIPRLLGGVPLARHHSGGRRVFHQDGAWVAIDDADSDASDADIEQPSVQKEYYKQLLSRYQALRATLGEMRSKGLPPRKDPDTGTSSSSRPPRSRHDWYCVMEREYPTPAQVSQMNQRAILEGLRYCAQALRRFDTISKQKSCWIWTLLALVGDQGVLDSEKMFQVRDIGCRAGQLGAELRRGAVTRPYADVSDDEVADEMNDAASEHSDIQEVEDNEEYEENQNKGPSEATQVQVPSRETADDSDAEMSMSEDDEQASSDNEAVDLEKARARLLAQLGDRLVQPGLHTTSHSIDSEAPHLHNGQAPQDVAHVQDKPVTRTFPSRAEAEKQRQQMRQQEQHQEAEKKSRVQQHAAKVVPTDQSHGMTAIDLNTRVTIDMILTVLIECYGQIDLQEFREVW